MKHIFQCEYCQETFSSATKAEKCELSHRATSDTFGYKLTMARLDKGLTQARLAEISGISPSNIHHYEYNKITPGINILKLLCKALDVTASDLLGC
jgi:DNA-binding XRE family transcriptional regulator